jgi:transcriptional regulator with XRE-family HTH domain
MAIDYFQVGQRLRAHRMGIGLSPDQAAKQLGISRAALYNYEKGEGPVKLETLERIAELLQTSLPSILGWEPNIFPVRTPISSVSVRSRLRRRRHPGPDPSANRAGAAERRGAVAETSKGHHDR